MLTKRIQDLERAQEDFELKHSELEKLNKTLKEVSNMVKIYIKV